MATKGAVTRGRGRPERSGTSRTRPCHDMLHLGVGRRRRQSFDCSMGFLSVPCAHSPGCFSDIQLGSPSIGRRLSIAFRCPYLSCVLFSATHTALHCPRVSFSSISGEQERGKEEDSIVFLKRRWQTHIPYAYIQLWYSSEENRVVAPLALELDQLYVLFYLCQSHQRLVWPLRRRAIRPL